MTAQGRGAERRKNDHYPTPDWATNVLIKHLKTVTRGSPIGTMIEPCAGRGAIVNRFKLAFPKTKITTVEIDPEMVLGGDHHTADFVTLTWPDKFDWAITNPPYEEKMLLPIVHHCFRVARRTALLLPMNWMFGSAKRHEFRVKHPFDMLTLGGRRPSFARYVKCGKKVRGKSTGTCGWSEWYEVDAPFPKICPECGRPTSSCTSDSSEYGWAIWPPDDPERPAWFEGEP